MKQSRKNRGKFIGLYLDDSQYKIIETVAKETNHSLSDLLRISIAKSIEPIYQSIIATNKANEK